MIRRSFLSLALLAGAAPLAGALPARAADAATPDDTARYLAGMPPASGANSALGEFRADPSWKAHSTALEGAFGTVEKRQLSKVRAWASENLPVKKPVLFYFFSGPDILYGNAFFPDTDTFVLAGLEPPGGIPDIAKVPKRSLAPALNNLRASMQTLLSVSFFRTLSMKDQFRATALPGTIPVLYTFLVRSGKTIKDASLVTISEGGDVQPVAEGAATRKGAPQGVKIVFSSPGGRDQTLYYFSTNIANDGFRNGFAQFVEKLGPGNAFVKSASYLLPQAGFSQVRDFLLAKSASILQDDSGIPLVRFGDEWQVKPFGRYAGPIALFSGYGQPKMRELYAKEKPAVLPFGVGYRFRPEESSLLLATRKAPLTQ